MRICKSSRKLLPAAWLLAMMVLILAMTGMTAHARDEFQSILLKEGTEIAPLDYNKYMDGDEVVWTYYRYRISVPDEGYLIFTVRNGSDESHLTIYDKLKTFEYQRIDVADARLGAAFIVPVSKGKIYMHLTDDEGALISYRFKKVTPKANYARAKAITLEENKKVRICQTPKYHYDRWYKLKIASYRRITFWTSAADRMVLCNTRLEKQEFKTASSGTNRYVTTYKLLPGTYYVRFKGPATTWEDLYMTSLRWRYVH